ncbi:MAG: phage protease [Candidatus Symbiobacter sp.]|nr:phage protease [Candidatus Symbiobacter sp.]
MNDSNPITANPAEWILLFAIGTQSARGFKQQFTLRDNAHAEQVIARTKARLGATQLLVDYEHQSTHTETNGQPAPAAGWVQELAIKQSPNIPGIYARVAWNTDAERMILGKEYRYISPVFMCNAETGEVLYFKSVGLTNTPAMDLILWKEPPQESEIVNMKEIAIAVGLPDTANPDEIATAIIALRAKNDEATKTAIANATPVPALPPPAPAAPVAPASERERELETQIITLRSKIAEEAVEGAIIAGQLTPAQREGALVIAKANLEDFRKFTAASAVTALLKTSHATATAPPANGMTANLTAAASFSHADREVMARMGLEESDFKLARSQNGKVKVLNYGSDEFAAKLEQGD